VRLVTTQNTYLSISGFEAFTGAAPAGGMTRMRTTTRTSRSGGHPMMRMGGGMMRRSLSFSMGNTKVSLKNASQKSPYGNNGYPATNAFSNGSKFTHTNKGVGMWWKASFDGGAQWVWKVYVKNRKDCCGGRLSGVKVTIGGQDCG
jgi:hypothetical protein